MARWHRWEFSFRAPAVDFIRLFHRALAVRGVHVEDAAHFDLVARAFGCRGYVAHEWTDAGLALVVKVKGGLFGSPVAMERILREAADEAAARVVQGADVA